MIYLDHAATSFPKSAAVRRAMNEATLRYAANPGRGGYAMALNTSEKLYACREVIADRFGVADPAQVVFTLNCTAALNTAIRSIFAGGGRAVVSDLEHNAVIRPLYAAIPHGIDVAHVTLGDSQATVEAFRRAMTPHTKAIVCTHASNVIGTALPIRALAMLAHNHGIPLVVDGAQSAGHLPIDIERDGIDVLCLAGHKGIGGPMGTGMLLCRRPMRLEPLTAGGTGSYSASPNMPDEWPERFESGTPNVVGICGLAAAVESLKAGGVHPSAARAAYLCEQLYRRLAQTDGIRLLSPCPIGGESTPVISLLVPDVSVEDTCAALHRHGIAVRGGLHCAPAAHRSLSTLPHGTVRLSVGVGNTLEEIRVCAEILKKIAKNPLCFRGCYDKI